MAVIKRETIDEVGIIAGLVFVQFLQAGNSVVLSLLLSSGVPPLTIVIVANFAAFLILSPLAVVFERKQWPRSLSLGLMMKFLLISFAGVTAFQVLFFQGLKLTSPAIATAMPNLAPGLIFFIAWTFRLEKVRLSCVYSRVKIVGTTVCVVGALTMSLMNSAPTSAPAASEPLDEGAGGLPLHYDKDKLLGCLYLLSAVFILSANTVLQALTLMEFPAPLTLSAVTCLVGSVMTVPLLTFQYHSGNLAWPFIGVGLLIAITMLGGALNGASLSFLGWAIEKRGPVTVSLFTPVGTLISVFLSMFNLGDKINLGSVFGMLLMFGGLYSVVWAKGKEGYAYGRKDRDGFEELGDEENALLS